MNYLEQINKILKETEDIGEENAFFVVGSFEEKTLCAVKGNIGNVGVTIVEALIKNPELVPILEASIKTYDDFKASSDFAKKIQEKQESYWKRFHS